MATSGRVLLCERRRDVGSDGLDLLFSLRVVKLAACYERRVGERTTSSCLLTAERTISAPQISLEIA
jgi:hypothetical protein